MNYEQGFSTVKSFVEDLVTDMEHYIKDKYKISLKIDVAVSGSSNRRWSRGGLKKGQGFIKILVNRYILGLLENKRLNEIEYKHIAADPVIGSLVDASWQQACASLVAHEVAHVVQFYPETKQAAKNLLGIADLDDRNQMLTGHDWFWQRIYADLRTQFVNDSSLVESKVLKTASEAPKSKKNSTWYSKQIVKHGGRHFYYYDTNSNELLGHLFNKNRCLVQMWIESDKKWKTTDYSSIVTARKALLGL